MRARHGRMVLAAIRHTLAALEERREPGADLEDLAGMESDGKHLARSPSEDQRLHGGGRPL